MTPDIQELIAELEEALADFHLPLRYDEATRNIYTAEEEYDGEQYHSWLAECGSPTFGRLSVAAVNALPTLLEAVKRQGEALRLGKIVMNLLEEHGASIVPHILDSDENAGERFRQAIARAALKETTDV